MGKKSIDPNAAKALEEMKIEIARELGISEDLISGKGDQVTNLITPGPIGGLMTKKLVEMGEKELLDEE